jgi:two-component system NtrC family sensor kinase
MEMVESELEHIPNERTRTEAAELLHSVRREMKRLEAITDAYLQFVSTPSLRVRTYSLHRMLKELQQFTKREMDARKIEFVNEFSADVPRIRFDKDRLREAVLNLYINAADAMPDGGGIRTSTVRADEWVEIHISDTGAGIPDAEVEKVFEPFFSNKPAGTGLGLTISRDILSAHGGTIEVYPRPRDGTTLILKLPIR